MLKSSKIFPLTNLLNIDFSLTERIRKYGTGASRDTILDGNHHGNLRGQDVNVDNADENANYRVDKHDSQYGNKDRPAKVSRPDSKYGSEESVGDDHAIPSSLDAKEYFNEKKPDNSDGIPSTPYGNHDASYDDKNQHF